MILFSFNFRNLTALYRFSILNEGKKNAQWKRYDYYVDYSAQRMFLKQKTKALCDEAPC